MKWSRLFATHNLVAASAWASKGVIAGSQLFGIKLLLDILGPDQYGIYVVIASLAGWIQLMDFGVGNATQNGIAEHREAARPTDPVIASLVFLLPALLLMFGLALVTLAVTATSAKMAFLQIAMRPGLDVLLTSCCVFFASAIGGISYKIWYAEQRGWWANLFPALAALMGLSLLLAARTTGYHDFLGVLLLFHAPPALLASVILVWRVVLVRTQVAEALRLRTWKPLVRRASGFFAFAFSSALVLQLDYIIMSAYASIYDVVSYNIISRVFAMVTILHTAYLNALWPVCTQALAAGRRAEVESLIRRGIGVGVLLVIGFYGAFVLGRHEVALLLVKDASVPLPAFTISLMAGYYLIRAWCDSWAIAFLSAADLTPLWLLVPVQAAVSIGLQLAFVRSFGVNGIIIALSLSFLLTVAWLLPLLARKRILLRG